MSEVLTLAKSLIEIPSVTPEDAGCQQLIADYLAPMGFTRQHLDHNPVSNLWCCYGQQGPLLAFAGHTDVVPAGDLSQWRYSPFTPTIFDDHLWGRGAQDMKGNLAAMLVAAKRWVASLPQYGQLAFMITSAEEGSDYHLGTPKLLEWCQQHNIHLNACVVGEPSSEHYLGDTIRIGRRGSLNGSLTLFGIQGHVAYPEKAKNAAHHGVQLLQQLTYYSWDDHHPEFPKTSLQITQCQTGVGATNVIPGVLTAQFNIRYNPAVTASQLQLTIEQLLKDSGCDFQIKWDHSAEPFITKPGRLIDATELAIDKICQVSPKHSTAGGTSDARFIAQVADEVIEFGCVNSKIHQIDEAVAIQELEQLVDIYTELLHQYFLSSA